MLSMVNSALILSLDSVFKKTGLIFRKPGIAPDCLFLDVRSRKRPGRAIFLIFILISAGQASLSVRELDSLG